ncbi:hypothetical protein BaRGS_00008674 [Batillaria attramentaria]|uniref:Uncharacterized protein n=1 Tax=Batillaria attramentaria TaxID=370345 RepID=A0ABD0LMA9_9CAEN
MHYRLNLLLNNLYYTEHNILGCRLNTMKSHNYGRYIESGAATAISSCQVPFTSITMTAAPHSVTATGLTICLPTGLCCSDIRLIILLQISSALKPRPASPRSKRSESEPD